MRKFVNCLLVLGLMGSLSVASWAEDASKDFKVDPTLVLPGEELCDEGVRPVTPEEKKEIEGTLSDLYKACEAKDVDKVLDIISDCVEATASEYASRNENDPEAADKIRDAFKYFFRDILNHEDFALDPFDIEGIYYLIDEDGTITVASPVPIISSTKGLRCSDSNDDYYMIVRLRLGRFEFKQIDSKWRIVKMDLF